MLIAELESRSIPSGALSFASQVFIHVKATQIECTFINARNCFRLGALIWKRIAFRKLSQLGKYSRLTREILAGSRSLFQFPLLSDSSLNVTITLLSRFFCFVFTKAFRSQYILVCYESPLSQSKSPYLIAVSGRKIWVRATACMSSCSPCLHIPSPACLPSTVSSLSPPFPSLPFSFLAVTSLFSGSIKKSREGENRVDRRGEKNYRRESKRGGKKGEKKSGGAKHAGRSSA